MLVPRFAVPRSRGVFGTLSVLEANDSQEDLVMHRSESGEMFRAEGPRLSRIFDDTPAVGCEDWRCQLLN